MEIAELLAFMQKNKDALQALSWLVASVGGVFAGFMAVYQLYETRRWKKTELARQIVNEIWENPKCAAAMKLVDWSNRRFNLDEITSTRITRDEVLKALRLHSLDPFSEIEVYVRDCFDDLLDALQGLEHYIERNLIAFDDVEYLLEYTACELSGMRATVEAYITEYEFHKAARFLERYRHWRDGEDRGREACVAAGTAVAGDALLSEEAS